ncbi:hypothetical protein GN156_15245 [bacterium LRH843]|nr:hypothetical protein [bacterium LRH843]
MNKNGKNIHKGGLNNLRWFFAFPFILLGSFLFALTINDIGIVGNIIKTIIGVGCFYIAGFIVRNKNGKKQSS